MQATHSDHAAFWDHLLEVGVLDGDQVQELQRCGSHEWPPLGQFLVQLRIVTVQQIMAALQLQLDDPHLRLGEILVREGHCGSREIDRAIKEQRRHSRHPIELLLERPESQSESFHAALGDYVSMMESRVTRLTDLLEKREAVRK